MAKIDLTYPQILDLFPQHLDPKRTESASFLIWYLENYLRLDPIEAVDAVCDQSGDKGVDGIYINEDASCIEVYQSKISQKQKSSIGDTALKEFEGTLKQFKDAASVKALIASAGTANVAILIEKLDIANKVKDYDVKGVFLSNIDLDNNGRDYLKSHSAISFVGRAILNSTFISSEHDAAVTKEIQFDISGYEISNYIVDKGHKSIIAPLKASELIKMEGITNQSLFAFNVRGPLGRTQVNKDIAESIKDKSLHKMFPLFHNGITIIADTVKVNKDILHIKDYCVVNGCQSLSELYYNSQHITDNLRILAKIIRIEPSSELSEKVTSFSNNQNGVKARDFKSNNPIQIRLQHEFGREYKTEWFYEIKRGEDSKGATTIRNEDAGLYLMAFDLKKPWATHRKYQVFEDDYGDIFGRPVVNAHRIVLCQKLAELIGDVIPKLRNSLFAKYSLTRYLLLYILRLILEEDDIGKIVLQKPAMVTLDQKSGSAFFKCVKIILDDAVIDLNAEVDQLGDDFDYRGKLRDEQWVSDLAHSIVADYNKLVSRGRILGLASEYKKLLKKPLKRVKIARN